MSGNSLPLLIPVVCDYIKALPKNKKNAFFGWFIVSLRGWGVGGDPLLSAQYVSIGELCFVGLLNIRSHTDVSPNVWYNIHPPFKGKKGYFFKSCFVFKFCFSLWLKTTFTKLSLCLIKKLMNCKMRPTESEKKTPTY